MKYIPETTNHKKIWQTIMTLVVLFLAVYLILPQITAIENSWHVLANMLLWAVGLAFLAQALSYLGSGYLLKKTLEITHQVVSLIKCTLIVLGAASISLVAGGTVGGSAAIFQWTSNEKHSVGSATLASILPSLFNTLVLVVLSIFGLVHLILIHDLASSQLIGFSITLILLGSVIGISVLASHYRNRTFTAIIWVAKHIARLRRKPLDINSTQHEIENIFLAWDELWGGEWHRLVLGAFLNVAFDMLTLYLLFIAAGDRISFGMLFSGYALPLLLGRIAFILPGGVGVVETSMVALYISLGISKENAVVVVEVYRLISFWIPTLAGFPIAAYLQRSRISNHKKPNVEEPIN